MPNPLQHTVQPPPSLSCPTTAPSSSVTARAALTTATRSDIRRTNQRVVGRATPPPRSPGQPCRVGYGCGSAVLHQARLWTALSHPRRDLVRVRQERRRHGATSRVQWRSAVPVLPYPYGPFTMSTQEQIDKAHAFLPHLLPAPSSSHRLSHFGFEKATAVHCPIAIARTYLTAEEAFAAQHFQRLDECRRFLCPDKDSVEPSVHQKILV